RFLDADAVGIKGDRLGLGRLRRLGGRGKARVLVWVRVLRVAHVIRLRTGSGRAGPSDARVSPPATGRPDAPPRPARTPRPSRGETASGSGRKTQPDGGSRRATPRASARSYADGGVRRPGAPTGAAAAWCSCGAAAGSWSPTRASCPPPTGRRRGRSRRSASF